MKILMILNNQFTHDTRVLKEGQSLVNMGHQVELLGFHSPNLPRHESVDGINVRRLTTIPLKRVGVIVKIWYYIQFYLSVLMTKTEKDAIHCHDVMMLPLGVLLKLLSGGKVKLVYDSHEYQIEQNGKSKFSKHVIRCIEGFFIRYAEAVIVVSESIANEYMRLYNIKKPYVIYNCPPFKPSPQSHKLKEVLPIADEAIICVYQGALITGRGVEKTIECFLTINDPKYVVVFMGFGPLASKVQEAEKISKNIFYLEAVPYDDLLMYTASANVGLCFIDNTCLSYYYCLPNKFFDYSMAEIPIVTSRLYELERMVTQYGNGFICEDNTADALKHIIEKLDKDMLAKLSKKTKPIKKLYCWENQEKSLAEIYPI